MKNKTRDILGIATLLLGFMVFMITPVRFTGMAIGGSNPIEYSILSLVGMLIMALGIFFIKNKK